MHNYLRSKLWKRKNSENKVSETEKRREVKTQKVIQKLKGNVIANDPSLLF